MESLRLWSRPGLIPLLAVLASPACSGDDHTAPVIPTPSAAPATPAVTLTRLTLSGPTTFSRVGETGQMTATGSYSDGSSKDVTGEVTWTSLNTNIIAVLRGGVISVIDLGSTYINARLGNQIGVALITATSPGTHTVYGRVREPGRGGLAGVQVVESESGRFAISNAEGQYSIGGIRNTLLTFEKAGYELVTTTVTPDTSSDTPMQPVLRMNAGETLTAQLAPNEVRYAPRGDECECKLIRVLVGTSGTLRVTVTRSSGGELLALWIEGYRKTDPGASLVGEHQVTPGEVLLHVGVSPRPSGPYINFSVTSELRAN